MQHPLSNVIFAQLRTAGSRLAPLVSALPVACSGSDASEVTLASGRHAIVTTIFQADGQTSLLGVVDDPTLPAVFDVARAAEVGGSAALFGRDGRSVFALGSSDSATLTRYELSEAGALQARAALSLQPYGIGSAFKRPELVPFVSDTKAYWIDDVSGQVVVWNPTEMTVTGSFSIAAAERDGYVLELGEATARGELVVVSANYRADDETEAGQAVALVLDTATDTLSEIATDDRCGGTLDIAAAEDGSLYFASNSFAASLYALGRPANYPEPCILRFAPEERRFDPAFYISTLALTGGRPAGQLVVGSEGRAYMLAFDADLLAAPIDASTDIFAPYEAAAWRWWTVELGVASPGVMVDGVGVRSAANRVLSAGGREYVANLDNATGRTTLLVPQPGGALSPGLEISGYPYGLLALR